MNRIRIAKKLSFRAVFNAAADAMLLSDDSSYIMFVNPAAQELLGYREDEMKGQAIEVFITPRYRKRYRYYQKLFKQVSQAPHE